MAERFKAAPHATSPHSKLHGRMQLRLGDELYLWILVASELLAIAWLRRAFRRTHGG